MSPLPADINECEDISDKVPLCQNGQCTNTEGSYKCTCLPGFVASAEPHKCIPEIPASGLVETGNWDRLPAIPAPLKITLHPSALSPKGLALNLQQYRWDVQTLFPTHTYRHKRKHTYIAHMRIQHRTHSYPLIHIKEDQELCSECITWDLVFTRYPFALKGFCGLILFYSVTPGNLICRYIFHIFFSVTFFLLCYLFHLHDGPLQTKKATYFREHTWFLLFYLPHQLTSETAWGDNKCLLSKKECHKKSVTHKSACASLSNLSPISSLSRCD